MILPIQRTKPNAILPNYAHPGDAGADIYAIQEDSLEPGESKLIPTGLVLEIPMEFEIQIRPRSGLALKNQITLLNSPATIDAGYRGELGVILINHGKNTFNITPGMKIAQIVIQSVITAQIVEKEQINNDTSRGTGGFGSTGK